MSLFRNEARKEHGSGLNAADMVAAMGEAHTARPMADGRADAAAAHAEARREERHAEAHRAAESRTAFSDTDVVEDAVELPRERSERNTQTSTSPSTPTHDGQRLAALLSADVTQDFRARWDATQIGFVDDPRQSVQQADELVAQVMTSLAQRFADERRQLETPMKDEAASTENLRVALQHYRSFFQRLLSLSL